MLIREGPQQWVAEEMKGIFDVSFRFASKTEPSDYVTKLSENMHLYPW